MLSKPGSPRGSYTTERCSGPVTNQRLLSDDQFIGFRFDNEPQSATVTTNGRILLNCQYTVEKVSVKDVRLEWKKDGSLINIKSSSRM